jgi:hypothetical protein
MCGGQHHAHCTEGGCPGIPPLGDQDTSVFLKSLDRATLERLMAFERLYQDTIERHAAAAWRQAVEGAEPSLELTGDPQAVLAALFTSIYQTVLDRSYLEQRRALVSRCRACGVPLHILFHLHACYQRAVVQELQVLHRDRPADFRAAFDVVSQVVALHLRLAVDSYLS